MVLRKNVRGGQNDCRIYNFQEEIMKKTITYLFIIFHSFITALNYQLFVFPNNFAPAGIGGICTMIQYVFNFRVGYLSFLINIPLAIAVYYLVSKSLAFRAMVYSTFFSVFLVVLDHVNLTPFVYQTNSSVILGPLVGGIVMGWSCAQLLRIQSHHAGVYFISNLVHHYRPDFNFSWVSFTLNIIVAGISYFVYGCNVEPVLLCILYCFSSSLVNDMITKNSQSAVRFEITTDNPEQLRDAIVKQLHHSATIIPGKGIYRQKETNVVVCVVNRSQAAAFQAILRDYPHTFAVMSQVNAVVGNFKHLTAKGIPESDMLDHGNAVKNR